MADATIAATSVAGRNTSTRSSGASTRSRADALRQASAPRSNKFSFTKQVAVANDQSFAAQQPAVAEPGKGLLSTSSQLILAETRAQDDQSSFADKSVIDTAVNSYNRAKSGVIETIGLSLLSGSGAAERPSETSA